FSRFIIGRCFVARALHARAVAGQGTPCITRIILSKFIISENGWLDGWIARRHDSAIQLSSHPAICFLSSILKRVSE
ncbi:MAG: hypothetical protein ACE5F6_09555, partial [Anaerolineae bacterium]